MSPAAGKRVLDVGQCQPDHGAIRELLRSTFGAEVEYAADIKGALQRLCESHFDLALVNRIIDSTSDEGIELIKRMKDSEFLCGTPIMMVSDLDTAQKDAAEAGAEPGFGKSELQDQSTRELFEMFLT